MEKIALKKHFFQTTTVSEQIYDMLRAMIINNEFGAEEPIVVSRLAQRLNISRTPLREAIKRLEEGGWVNKKVNRIVVAERLSLKETQEYCTIREVLEGMLARDAVDFISDRELEEAGGKLAQWPVLAAPKSKLTSAEALQMVALGRDFHRLIHEASRNVIGMKMLEEVNSKLSRCRSSTVMAPGRARQVLREHMEILLVMRQKKKDKVETAMRRHIANANKIYISEFMKKS